MGVLYNEKQLKTLLASKLDAVYDKTTYIEK